MTKPDGDLRYPVASQQLSLRLAYALSSYVVNNVNSSSLTSLLLISVPVIMAAPACPQTLTRLLTLCLPQG